MATVAEPGGRRPGVRLRRRAARPWTWSRRSVGGMPVGWSGSPIPARFGRWFVAAGLLAAAPRSPKPNSTGPGDCGRRSPSWSAPRIAGQPADDEAVRDPERRRRGGRPAAPARDHPGRPADRAPGRRRRPGRRWPGIARDAVRLLGGPQASRIKECQHPDCSLVFLDETQSARRRWCSMERCGNLVKTAATGPAAAAEPGSPALLGPLPEPAWS